MLSHRKLQGSHPKDKEDPCPEMTSFVHDIYNLYHIYLCIATLYVCIYIYSIHVYHCRIYINKWFVCPFDLMFFSNIFPHENNTIYRFRFRCLVWLALALSLDSVNADGEFVAPAFGIGGTFPEAGGAKGESRILVVNVWLWNRLEFTKGNIKVFYSIL